jgi:hypothetical protein
LIVQFLRLAGCRDDFKVVDTRADHDAQRVSLYDMGERQATGLTRTL